MKKILAVNSGSSSFKYKLFAYPEEKVIASGMADSVGLSNSVFKMKLADGTTYEEKKDIPNQEAAVQKLLDWLKKYKVINDLSELGGIGLPCKHGFFFVYFIVVLSAPVVYPVTDCNRAQV